MDGIKPSVSSKFSELCNFLESETLGTEVAIYGTAGVMLLVAYAKRKPSYLVRQFKKPSHIPDKIINDRVVHTGLIKGVEQRNLDTLILVNHRPMIPLFSNRTRVLPIKLPGVKVNGNGISWIQSCLVDRKATFIPLTKDNRKDYVVCQLCLVHPATGKQLIDISETLLKLGFAKYVPAASTSGTSKYYKHLEKTEAQALTKQKWLLRLTRIQWLWTKLNELKSAIVPKQRLLPELVR